MKITSMANETVKRLASLAQKKGREEEGMFLLDGSKLIEEACRSSVRLRYVVYEEGAGHAPLLDNVSALAEPPYFLEVSAQVLKKISPACQPQGILAAADLFSHNKEDIRPNGRYLIADHLQDPGNLGTIFRTAEALGIDGVILTGETVDVFGTKAVRAAMGSSLRLPFYVEKDGIAMVRLLQEKGLCVYASALREGSVPVTEVSFEEGCAVVIGNEGMGLSDELCDVCSQTLTIPMAGVTESLNAAVAATIFMWEMRK